MKIKAMLTRLQAALGVEHLSEQMLLLPGTQPLAPSQSIKADQTTKNPARQDRTTIVIGYNDSPNSRTALDFALWMAYQTRLACQHSVTVHVVYVLDRTPSSGFSTRSLSSEAWANSPLAHKSQSLNGSSAGVMELPAPLSLDKQLEQGDRILWQARCLAEEWRGSLEAHLRFGDVATELYNIVEAESADLLFVGCSSVRHPLIQELTPRFPCPVLGIPTELESN
ncbi:MAG: universal stress protein [Oculatellaceae cyanobacterium Prado106]|jgi:nucleotide-binding universal stress UspA family protein|nr:universal stress protein [Oculatellaceae cyanobacterium Prado106]